MEEYRDMVGYEGLYMVSNKGNVKSLERKVWNGRGRGFYMTVPERILKPIKTGNGYLQVDLSKDGKIKRHLIHRLVAEAFIPNPNNLEQVNHRDECKTNNNVENLEWCSSKYNCNYGTRIRRITEANIGNPKLSRANTNNPKLSKPVIAIDKVSGLILEYPSTQEASRQTGTHQGSIVACCKGRKKSAGNYYWMYADQEGED